MIDVMGYSITLIPCLTIRDKNGLALSSRNQYLSLEEQQSAAIIYQSLIQIKTGLDNGEAINQLKQKFCKKIQTIKDMSVDYISISCSKTLEEIIEFNNQEILISTSVIFKSVRLIDNITYQSSTK